MTAQERKHLERFVLAEIVAAFLVTMVVLVALSVTGRLDGPYRGAIVCEAPAQCERLLEP